MKCASSLPIGGNCAENPDRSVGRVDAHGAAPGARDVVAVGAATAGGFRFRCRSIGQPAGRAALAEASLATIAAAGTIRAVVISTTWSVIPVIPLVVGVDHGIRADRNLI